MPTPPTPAEMFLAMTEAMKAPKGQMAKVLFETLEKIQQDLSPEIQETVSKDNSKRLPSENGEEE